MIELQHLSKWITIGGTKTFLLKDVSLTINEGEFVSIMVCLMSLMKVNIFS